MSSELDKESERCGGGARVEATFWPWLVYAFKTSEGANPSTTAAATRLFPGGLVWEFLTTTAAATTWDGEVNNERQTDTASHKESDYGWAFSRVLALTSDQSPGSFLILCSETP